MPLLQPEASRNASSIPSFGAVETGHFVFGVQQNENYQITFFQQTYSVLHIILNMLKNPNLKKCFITSST